MEKVLDVVFGGNQQKTRKQRKDPENPTYSYSNSQNVLTNLLMIYILNSP
jgi:hypothetical protein